MSLRTPLLVLAIALLSSSSVRADLIAADSFNDKTLGALSGQSGGTGSWTGNYASLSGVTVVAGGLNYAGGAASVNGGTQKLQISGAADDNVVDSMLSRAFASQTGAVYFSLLISPGQLPDPGVAGSGDFLQFQLNNDTNEVGSGSIGLGRTAGNNPFFSRVGTSATGDTDLSSVLAQANQTYLLVGRFQKTNLLDPDYNEMSLWINPTSAGSSNPLVSSSFDSGILALGVFNLRTAGLFGDTYFIDELRIGNSFDAVVVPEPSTCLSCGLLLAGSWIVRRRRIARAACETAAV